MRKSILIGGFVLIVVLTSIPLTVISGSGNDVRTTFTKFVTAQNDHNLEAVKSLLLDSPQFLWITRGTAIWGRQAALDRFSVLFKGTWHLSPDTALFREIVVDKDVTQICVPVTFSIGTANEQSQNLTFILNLVLVRREAGWQISSILPIPVPTAVK
ncbi:MAG: nuclear transport factor 2 family protein [Candidatus Zixiibacteriota bacterium]